MVEVQSVNSFSIRELQVKFYVIESNVEPTM